MFLDEGQGDQAQTILNYAVRKVSPSIKLYIDTYSTCNCSAHSFMDTPWNNQGSGVHMSSPPICEYGHPFGAMPSM